MRAMLPAVDGAACSPRRPSGATPASRGPRAAPRHAARRAECHGTRRLTLLDSSVVRGTPARGGPLADGPIEFGSLWCRSFSQRTSKTVRCLFRPSTCPPMVRRVVVARVPFRHVRRPRGSKRSKLPITRFSMTCTPRRRVASRAFFFRRSRWRTRNALRSQSRLPADRRGCD